MENEKFPRLIEYSHVLIRIERINSDYYAMPMHTRRWRRRRRGESTNTESRTGKQGGKVQRKGERERMFSSHIVYCVIISTIVKCTILFVAVVPSFVSLAPPFIEAMRVSSYAFANYAKGQKRWTTSLHSSTCRMMRHKLCCRTIGWDGINFTRCINCAQVWE